MILQKLKNLIKQNKFLRISKSVKYATKINLTQTYVSQNKGHFSVSKSVLFLNTQTATFKDKKR